MTRIMPFLVLLVLFAIASCNESPSGEAATRADAPVVSSETVSGGTAGGESPALAYQSVAGTKLALSTGESVEVLSVGSFDQKYKNLGGLVAIEGRIAQSFPEHGALILVDCTNMADCSDNCCPQAEVPVRLALENYDGNFPQTDANVIVIGQLTVKELGYELAVREIRHGNQVLLELAG